MKNNGIKKFVNAHKKEIAVAAVAGTIGVVSGFIGCKVGVSRKYGDLIEEVSKFESPDTGRDLDKWIAGLLGRTDGGVYTLIVHDDVTKTAGEALTDWSLSELTGIVNPDDRISGLMVCTIRNET